MYYTENQIRYAKRPPMRQKKFSKSTFNFDKGQMAHKLVQLAGNKDFSKTFHFNLTCVSKFYPQENTGDNMMSLLF